MLRVLFNALIIAIGTNIILEVMPWWMVVFVAFFVLLLFRQSAKISFLSGALGGGSYFLISALFTNYYNGGILAGRIAELFTLPSPYIIIFLTFLIGFISGGLGGLLANKFFNLLKPHNVE